MSVGSCEARGQLPSPLSAEKWSDMRSRAWLLLFLSVVYYYHCMIIECNSQSVSGGEVNKCLSKETCRDCLRTSDCVWCARPLDRSDASNSQPRCTRQAEQNWCSQEYIVNKTSSVEVLENRPLRGLDESSTEAIQLKPQRLKVSLRPGTEVSVPFQYRQAEDYPVDLYFLMDLSSSMIGTKTLLSELGDKIIISMKKKTNNFRIGFGSFVDKPEMPFVSTAPDRLRNPCVTRECVTPYGYRNHLPLTSDTIRFSREVKSAPISGNQDSPEGGLDAMMQVLVCTDEIGWRPKARHLLIFSTDASFHLAGDGKLAGIVEPNDEMCHLDAQGNYTHSLEIDYPSIWQIDKRAKENNINIIFAVTSLKKEIYTELKNVVTGSYIGILSNDSSNIVGLVATEYDKIVSSVKITENAGGPLEVKYKSVCLGNEEKFTNECEIPTNRERPTINFTAIIKASSCPGNKSEWKETIKIRPIALNESIQIDVEILCDCPCESPGQQGYEAVSKSCDFHGSLQCGICVCDSDRFGRFCECDSSDAERLSSDNNLCKAKTDDGINNSGEICSGRGSCKCGKCDCAKRPDLNERIYGTHCECDNFSCERFDGLVCSGLEKGQCDCGKCICQAGWGGHACNCRDTNTTCIAPNSDKVCTGQGECVCGSCKCNMINNVRYSGRYCENCPSCPVQRCNELMKCVECQAYKTGPYASNCENLCPDFEVKVIDEIEEVSNEDNRQRSDIPIEIRICRTPDDSGCTIVFKYLYEGMQGQLSVWALRDKECGRGVDTLAIVGGVVASIVFGGIILLIIWKVTTTVHDRREYVKFETERRLAEWDKGDNPLYKPSTSTFQNPTFFSNK